MPYKRRLASTWAGLAVAALVSPAASAPADLEVSLARGADKIYSVSGEFKVDAASATVWDVLTDYEGIPAFVHSMKKSRVREARADGTVILDQEAIGGLFLISRRVKITLAVRRLADRLDFEDTAMTDFRVYLGSWQAQDYGGATFVKYGLRADPKFPAPGFLMKNAMRKGAIELLEQVRAEIRRRASALSSPR